jgi:mRNA-degrading endonuclease toxin of MazEF toxin-antitoxin module
MEQVRRGDIWEIRRFGAGEVSTELGATKPEEPRRCIVVSSDRYNEMGERVTVAPLRSFDSPSWSAVTDSKKWAELLAWSRKAQWWGVILCNDWLEERRRGLTKLVLADCGQLRSFAAEGFANNSCCGRVDDTALHNVEAALHTLLNSSTRRHRTPARFRQGDILEANLPGSRPDYAVVVSCNDYASDNLWPAPLTPSSFEVESVD